MALKDKTGKVLSRSEGEAVLKGRASVTITIYAAILALCSLLSNGIGGRILTDNIMANDAWAFYQAKSIKQDLYEVSVNNTTDKSIVESYRAHIISLDKDKEAISSKAKALELDRDLAKSRSPFFGYANTVLQISIVLSTTAILAVSLTMWYASIGTGILGIILLCNGIWYFLPL